MSITHQAVDSCPSAFIVINSKGIIIETNKSTADLFGYKKSELIGLEIEALIPIPLQQAHKKYVQKYFENPDSRKMGNGRILEGCKKDKTIISVEVGINFFKENGEIFGVANIVDYTHEHRMRKLLERTQEVARIGSWQLDINTNKCIWSKMTYKIHEVAEGAEIPIEDAINFYAPEHREVIQSCVDDALNKRTSWDIELKIITTTGQEKWVKAIGSPVIIGEQVVGLEGTFQDIHDQKILQLEKEELLYKLKTADNTMKSLHHRLTLALSATSVGIWEWNILTNQLIWDQQMYSLYGIKEEDFDGAYSAWENGLHPDDKGPAQELIQKAVKGEAKFDTEFRVVHPNGSINFLRAIATLEYNHKKEPVSMIGVNWDITQEKINEEKLRDINSSLEKANEELMQFSYRSSHDLKAPLVTIRNLADIILDDIQNDIIDEAVDNIKHIKSQAETLESLVNDLLNLAKADASDKDLRPLDFKAMAEKILQINEGQAKENNVEIKANINVTSEFIFPYVRIFQIINNLVSNGIKYYNDTRQSPYVTLTLQNKGKLLEIIVEDNGMGIPAKDKNEIYQMFKRYHSKNISGSGIGMYVLKKHIDYLDGEIDYTSSAEGTRFTVKCKGVEEFHNSRPTP